MDAAIAIDNAEDTAATMTDAIIVTSSGVDAGVTDGLDVSAANILYAINVGANPILGGDETLSVGATDDTLIFTSNDATPTFTGADAAGASDTIYDTTGAGKITVGSGDVTAVDIVTDGGTVTIDGAGITPAGITSDPANGNWTFTKTAAGGATLIGADDAGAANMTLDTTGAGAITIGSNDVTAVTVVADGTADADFVVPENSIGPDEVAVMNDVVIFCGAAAENGTIYYGPATAVFGGDGSASYAISSPACDALANGAEATADAPIFTNVAFKVTGMYCKQSGTLGAGEAVTFTLRSAAADTTPAISCTINAGETDCRSLTATTTDIAAGATVAVKAVQASDNADDDHWCKIYIAYK